MKIKFLSIVLLSVVLTGCATTGIKPNQPAKPGESLVFGRFNFNLKWRGLLKLVFKNLDTSKSYMVEMNSREWQNNDWYYVISLPPGKYQTVRIVQDGFMTSWMSFKTYFTVTESASVYLGTLNYQETDTANFLFLVGTHRIAISVKDEKDKAVDYLTKKGYQLGDRIVESVFSGGDLVRHAPDVLKPAQDQDPLAPFDKKQFSLQGTDKREIGTEPDIYE
jgi:hypothetical protein